MTMVAESFIGYEIDMLLEYNDGEVAIVNVRFQGKVVYILNQNTSVVNFKCKE